MDRCKYCEGTNPCCSACAGTGFEDERTFGGLSSPLGCPVIPKDTFKSGGLFGQECKFEFRDQLHIWRLDFTRDGCHQFGCRLCDLKFLINAVDSNHIWCIPKGSDPSRDLDAYERIFPRGVCCGKKLGRFGKFGR